MGTGREETANSSGARAPHRSPGRRRTGVPGAACVTSNAAPLGCSTAPDPGAGSAGRLGAVLGANGRVPRRRGFEGAGTPALVETLVLAPVRSITLSHLLAPSLDPPIPDTASPGERASASQAQGDAAAFALLYGRYLGQITARIERAWMRPRNSPGSDTFACRLQVLQDERGQVLGVTVGHCNGDARWRASLVQAVRSASPLPAPPDSHVFRRSVGLAFTSAAFVPGGSTQGFEPEALTAMTAPAGSAPAGAAPDYLDQLRALREGRPGSVDLRIEGNRHTNEATTGLPGQREESAATEVPATPR